MKRCLLFMMLLTCTISLYAQEKLSKDDALSYAKQRLKQRQEESVAQFGKEWENRELTNGSHSMKFFYKVFGEKPSDGRALFISMHGGGGAPAELNDKQWENQKHLYKPAEGVYWVPRSPTNTWNMWHQGYMDGFIKKIIELAVINEGVNPNKVYIMGYSAGGDGTYQLAPRLADKWAAGSMSAGHPGDAKIENLMNLPFAIYMGGKDAAFQRNDIAADWGKWIKELAAKYDGRYINTVNIYPECGHWMLHKDSVAVTWMAQFQRNPIPNHIHWIQDDVIRNNFYWLQATEDGKKKRDEIIISYEGNKIYIEEATPRSFAIRLNDNMMNLNKAVTVYYKGDKIFKGKVIRTKENIDTDIAAMKDIDQIFSAKLLVIDNNRVEVK